MRAGSPIFTKPMSCARIRASITSLSSIGTISTSGSPARAAAPSVVTATRFTTPRTGDTISVRATRSFKPGSNSCWARRSEVVRLSSELASERNCRTADSRRARISATPDSSFGMLTVVDSTLPCSSEMRPSRRTSSRRGSRPRSTMVATISRSSLASFRLR